MAQEDSTPTDHKPLYAIMATKEDVDRIQSLIAYCADGVEFKNFIEHLCDTVELEDEDAWADWEEMNDIPDEVLREFDEISSHVYRNASLVEEALYPTLKLINQDNIKALQNARDFEQDIT